MGRSDIVRGFRQVATGQPLRPFTEADSLVEDSAADAGNF
jgi:hypothetical protein